MDNELSDLFEELINEVVEPPGPDHMKEWDPFGVLSCIRESCFRLNTRTVSYDRCAIATQLGITSERVDSAMLVLTNCGVVELEAGWGGDPNPVEVVTVIHEEPRLLTREEFENYPSPSPRRTRRSPISRKLRFEILKRDGFSCAYCGARAPDVELHLDHVIPVSKHGATDATNLVTACVDCNLGKGSTSLDEGLD